MGNWERFVKGREQDMPWERCPTTEAPAELVLLAMMHVELQTVRRLALIGLEIPPGIKRTDAVARARRLHTAAMHDLMGSPPKSGRST